MRKYLLAAAAVAAISTPAGAQIGPYVGVEGGLLFPRDGDIEIDVEGDDDLDTDTSIDYKMGRDLDVIGGYDFGAFRLEGEIAWKRTRADEIEFEDDDDGDLVELGNPRVKVRSLMLNALGDFGASDGFGAYAGAGFGRARMRVGEASDRAWAWQLIAGVRTAITPNIDAGLKYRFLRTRKFNFRDDFEFDPGEFVSINQETRFSSHSLLASLIFNFGAPAAAPYIAPVAAPPPPPVAPATQTCPDGSVIMATDFCPAPMAPPPPPPPSPERG